MTQDIKIKWAVHENYQKISNHLLLPVSGYFDVVQLPITILFETVDFGDLNTNLTLTQHLNSKNKNRFLKIIEHCRSGGFLDPPILIIRNGENTYLENGRHRTIIAYHCHEKTIPVAIKRCLL